MAQRAESKEPARKRCKSPTHHSKSTNAPGCRNKIRKASQTSPTTCIRTRSEQPNEETHERRAAQAELKIAYDKCGPEAHGKSCSTRLNTFILAMRSTSRESSNLVHAARDLAVRCSNKHSVTLWDREAVFRNLGVVQDLAQEAVSSVSHCGLAATNYDNEFIATS